MRRATGFPDGLFRLLPLMFLLVQCAEGLGPDPDDYPPIIDQVENQAGEPIQTAAVGETVFIVGRNFTPMAKVFFAETEASVQAVSPQGTRIETVVPHVQFAGPVLLYVQVEDRKSNGFSFQVLSHNRWVGDRPEDVIMEDLDRDGDLDLVVRNSDTVSVLLGRGDGTFGDLQVPFIGRSPPTFVSMAPRSLAVGDLNNDNVPDLVVSESDCECLLVLPGRGDGTFGEAIVHPAGGEILSLELGDLDRDGNLDVAGTRLPTGDLMTTTINAFLGNGDGTLEDVWFHGVSSILPWYLKIEDLNRDGDPDLAAASRMSLEIFLGHGDGTFQKYDEYIVGGGDSYLRAAADLDNDGDPDLVMTVEEGSQSYVVVLLGNGDGFFQEDGRYLPGGRNPSSVAVEDLDGDGDADLTVACRLTWNACVLLNHGDGSFHDPGSVGEQCYATGFLPSCTAVGDIDRDGDQDLVVTNTGTGTVSLLHGKGDGTFGSALSYTTGPANRELSAADLDMDGDQDLAVAFFGNSDSPGGLSVLPGNGDGTFGETVNYEVGWGNPCSVDVGDLDRDGAPDLAVGLCCPDDSPGGLSVALNQGDGTFRWAENYELGQGPISVVSVGIDDFDLDGNQDIAVSYGVGTTIIDPQGWGGIRLFLGHGDGTFAASDCVESQAIHYSLALGDLDMDGDSDLAVSSYGPIPLDPEPEAWWGHVAVFPNNGDGTIGSPVRYGREEGFSISVSVSHLNGDGAPDLAVASYGPFGPDLDPELEWGDVAVFMNNGDGTFVDSRKYDTFGHSTWIEAGDLDGDGDMDLVTLLDSGVSVLLGNGDGAFGEAVSYSAGILPFSATVGDFDGDGDEDVAVTGGKDTVSILFAGN